MSFCLGPPPRRPTSHALALPPSRLRQGMRDSSLYVSNGMGLLLSWTLIRILYFAEFFPFLYRTRHELALVHRPTAALCVAVPIVIFCMNLMWYHKIVRGAFKLLRGSNAKDGDVRCRAVGRSEPSAGARLSLSGRAPLSGREPARVRMRSARCTTRAHAPAPLHLSQAPKPGAARRKLISARTFGRLVQSLRQRV